MSFRSLQFLCNKHKERVLGAFKKDNNMVCQKCLEELGIVALEDLQIEIESLAKNKINKLEESQQQSNKYLDQLKKSINIKKNKVIQDIEMIISVIDKEQNSINNKIFSEITQLSTGIFSLNITQLQETMKQLKVFQSETSDAIFKKNIEKIRQETNELYQILLNYMLEENDFNIFAPELFIEEKSKPIVEKQQKIRIFSEEMQKYEKIFVQTNIKCCYSLVMNKDENILIGGQSSDINVYGQLTFREKLSQHQGNINCLRFSKRRNWFISGSKDNTVKIWWEDPNQKWFCIYILQIDSVNDIQLNDEEDQFFTCSDDKTIKIWTKLEDNINWGLQQKLIDLSGSIYFLSLSLGGDQLLSCGEQKLKIWQNNNGQWIFNQEVENPIHDSYKAACFFNENQFIAQTNKYGNCKVIENTKKHLNVSQEITFCETIGFQEGYFPISYNAQLKIALCKDAHHIHILNQQSNGKFFKDQVFDGDYRGGYLSQQGQYLILAQYQSNLIEVWQRK